MAGATEDKFVCRKEKKKVKYIPQFQNRGKDTCNPTIQTLEYGIHIRERHADIMGRLHRDTVKRGARLPTLYSGNCPQIYQQMLAEAGHRYLEDTARTVQQI